MRVSDIMTPTLACCSPDTLLPEVAALMCDNDCGAIPVLDAEQRPIGIITDRDIACRAVAEGRDALQLEAREIMSKPVVTITSGTSVDELCERLEDHQLRRLVVVDGEGVCCGIVAQADVARHAPKQDTAEVVRAVSKPGQGIGAFA
jgi:CBS domain-containing protein